MYLRQKCPHCGTEREFVYVQIGHNVCCKKCNNDFVLEAKRFNPIPYLIWIGIALALIGLVIYLLKVFHDWWIYR